MRKAALTLPLLAFAAGLSGCANSSYPVMVPKDDYAVTQLESNQRYVVDEPLSVQHSNTAIGRFNAQMIFLTDQLERNVERKSLENTFIVTSFINLNRLNETTSFGRLVAEDVIHELQVRKWKVFEVRLTKDVIVNESGEFSLSRDVRKIREQYKVGGIVTGTYSVAGNHVVVNARVIDIGSGVVVSSAQIHLPVNAFTEELLFSRESLSPMRIVGDTPYSCRDSQVCWGGEGLKPAKDVAP